MVAHTSIEELAFFGGAPSFAPPLPTGQLDAPDVEDFLAELRGIAGRKWFSNGGPTVQALEAKLAEFHQVRHCIAVANAALGITMALQAVAGRRAGEVIIPAMGYRGLPHFARWAGQTPRFVDIDPETHTLHPTAVERAVGPDTTGILAISHFNTPGFIEELDAVSARTGVPLIYDSVDAVGSTYKGRPVGCFGWAEIFSLHATKLINGFEGGYITTEDDRFADLLRRQRDFNLPGRLDNAGDPNAHVLGMNCKLNEIHAAMALLSLDRVEGVIERNRRRFALYEAGLTALPGVRLLPYLDAGVERRNYRMVVLELLPSWPLTRDATVALLKAEGAAIRAYYNPPLYRLSPWVDDAPFGSWPVAEALTQRFLHLPTSDMVSNDDVARLINLLHLVGGQGEAIRRRMGTGGAA